MGENFWWILDIITVIVLVLCIIRCAHKGFSKIIITAVGCVISLVAAWIISGSSSEFIYNNFFKKSNIETLKASIKDYHPEEAIKNIIEENDLSGVLSTEKIESVLKSDNSISMLYEYANSESANILDTPENFKNNLINEFAKAFAAQAGVNLPPYVAQEIIDHIGNNEKLFKSTIKTLMTQPDKVPEYIEENYIRAPAKRIISSAVFLIVFFVLITIILLVTSRSQGFGLLNGYDRLDKFAGGLMGLIEGITIIMIIGVGMKILINISENENSFFSMNTIENTKVFRLFYKFL